MIDALGDKIKRFEMNETHRRFIPGVPVYARIDGRSFSKFTRNMKRPYDQHMTSAMISTTKALVRETNATIGYTQSDEISLVWTDISFFDGKIFKVLSQLSAIASVYFMKECLEYWPEKLEHRLPTFDARVFQVPNKETALQCLEWREWDATKNSIQMAAQSVCSHKELQNKNRTEQLDMLIERGINWNDYPPSFKRGTYVKRVVRDELIDDGTWNKIPDKHKPESRIVTRSHIIELDLEPFTKLSDDDKEFMLS